MHIPTAFVGTIEEYGERVMLLFGLEQKSLDGVEFIFDAGLFVGVLSTSSLVSAKKQQSLFSAQ